MIKGIFRRVILLAFSIIFCLVFIENMCVINGIAASEFEYIDKETGVRFYAEKGVVPDGAHFVTEQIIPGLYKEDTQRYNDALKDLDEDKKKEIENLDLYRIDLVNDKNEKVLPNGYIRVMLPISKRFDEEDIEVLKILSGKDVVYDNQITTVNGNRYCVFKTNSFSTYCLIDRLAPNEMMQVYVPYIVFTVVLCAAIVLYFVIRGKRLR